MDTMLAFAMGEANRGKEKKVFDWDKAAKLIKNSKCDYAAAGLAEDWEYTGDTIYKDGKPYIDKYSTIYLASTWATPVLIIDGDETDCYIMEHETKWNADTKWPKSALDILNGKDEEE